LTRDVDPMAKIFVPVCWMDLAVAIVCRVLAVEAVLVIRIITF